MAKKVIRLSTREPKITVTVDDERLSLALNKFGARISDLRPFWTDDFAPQFFDDIQRNFAAEGKYVGGWRALSPEYAAWKLRKYGRKKILDRTGAMKESLRLGGRGNILNVFKLRAIFGSLIHYLPYHQRGTSRMPQRKVLWIGPNRTYQRLLNSFVAGEMRAAGLPNVRTRAGAA